MSDPIVWIIIFVFYAPLHFMLPVLFLFIVGNEADDDRKRMIQRTLIDAAISMAIAFALAILLVYLGYVAVGMVVLILFMAAPFVRIVKERKKLA